MESFEESRVAQASPEQVFAVLTDPDRGTEWSALAKEVRAEGPPGEGRTLFIKGAMLGVTLDMEQTVHTYEAPTRYGWSGTRPFASDITFELTPEGDGTRITAHVQADPGKVFPVGKRLVMRTFRKQFGSDLDRLVKLVEAEA